MTAEQQKEDWTALKIIGAVRVRGTTIAALSRYHGLGSSTLGNALYKPWPKGELILAEFLGVEPQEIWPSRFTEDGKRKTKRVIKNNILFGKNVRPKNASEK